jgi:type I restriction enzyme S subunit
MGADWPRKTVAECAAPEPYSTQIGPFGKALMADEYVASGVPVLRGLNVNRGRFHDDDFVFIDDATASRLAKFESFPGDVLLVHKGTLGEIGLMPTKRRHQRYIMGNSMMRVRCDPQKLLPEYLYYWLTSAEGQHYLFSRVSQVGVPQIQTPLTTLRLAELPVPPLAEQRAIAHILGTLDDKIELNRRMTETLEAMARALFKSWFVDFDPLRAKAERRDPGLPRAIVDLFPDRLVDSRLGEIPEGWEASTVGDHLKNFDSMRVPVSGAERAEHQGPYPYHGAAGVMDHVDRYLFDGTFLLIGEDGSVVQDTGLAVTQYVWGKFWVNNHAHVLQGRGHVSTEQLYLYFHFELVAPYVTGAVQPKLSQGRMNIMPFVFAGEAVCRAFGDTVKPWFARLRSSVDETKTLAALRDTLLPKLVSGELRVRYAERLVAAAGV